MFVDVKNSVFSFSAVSASVNVNAYADGVKVIGNAEGVKVIGYAECVKVIGYAKCVRIQSPTLHIYWIVADFATLFRA